MVGEDKRNSTFVGFIAMIVNFMFRPDAVHFLGFTAASTLFDVIASLTGYKSLFENTLAGSVVLFALSLFSAAFAGLIIGVFFMEPAPFKRWGGGLAWLGLHAAGGIIGGVVGAVLMTALIARGITAKGTEV